MAQPTWLVRYAIALLRAIQAQRVNSNPHEVMGLLEDCLQTECQDRELHFGIIYYAVLTALLLNDTKRAERLIQQFMQIDEEGIDNQWVCLSYIAQSKFHARQYNLQAASQTIAKTKTLSIAVGCYVWRLALLEELNLAFLDGYFQQAHHLLEKLKPHVPDCPIQQGDYLLAVLRVQALTHRFAEGEKTLQQIPLHEYTRRIDYILKFELMIYWGQQKFDEAQKLLVQHAHRLPESLISLCYAKHYRRIGRLDQSQKWLNAFLDQLESKEDSLLAIQVQLDSALARRERQESRALLTKLDPSKKQTRYEFEWFRLFLLEENQLAAAEFLNRFMSRSIPGQLEMNLAGATEVTAFQFLAAKQLAKELRSESSHAPLRNDRVKSPVRDNQELCDSKFIGSSQVMMEIRSLILKVARLPQTVLLTGETGTGKEVTARLLHQCSEAKDKPFIAINCGGLPENLIESELFGHVKGAFTGATHDSLGLFVEAGEGTLFLDEVNSMSPRLQTVLLRTLEDREVRPVGGSKIQPVKCRVIAASNQSLEKAVETGCFRSDLYFRLAQIPIRLPSLKERPEDIIELAYFFLHRINGNSQRRLSTELEAAMKSYSWPGNVRELKHKVEYMALVDSSRPELCLHTFEEMLQQFCSRRPEEHTSSTETQRHEVSESTEIGSLSKRPIQLKNPTSRRRYLQKLFAKHHQLTRAEIVELVGCAPNTATRDLRELEKEGVIRRISTSNNLKTSYFVHCVPD